MRFGYAVAASLVGSLLAGLVTAFVIVPGVAILTASLTREE